MHVSAELETDRLQCFKLISVAMKGDNAWAASFIILGPKPSSPDALVESNLLICINICSGVIKGIAKCISLGTFLSIKQLIFVKIKLLVFLFEFESFRISATDAKYLFSLFAGSRESVICS